MNRSLGAAEDPLVTLLRQGRSFSGRERHCSFLNTGGARRFADVSEVSGLSLPEDGTGVAFCDWDHDGDLDLWMANRSGPQVRFFQNEIASPGRSVRVLLRGTLCNRDAIGARVTVTLANGKPVTKTLRAGEGYLSQSSKWLHFGLGDDEVERIEVRWPGGEREDFSKAKSGGAFSLRQGEGVAVEWSPPARGPTPSGFPHIPEKDSTASIKLGIPMPLPLLEYETDAGESAALFGEPLRGKRGLLVTLWSGWCEDCLKELGELADVDSFLESEKIGVLALNVDDLDGGNDDSKRAQKILREIAFPFSSGKAPVELVKFLQLMNDELLVAQRPLPVPTSFLIDHNWRLVAIYKGKVEAQEVLNDLSDLALPFEARRSKTLSFPGRWNVAPKNFVLLNFADRLFQRGFFEEGNDLVTRYSRFLEPQPLFPGLLTNAGLHSLKAGRNQEARDLFQRTLELDSNQVPALHGLAKIYSSNAILQSHKEALKLSRRAATLVNYRDPAILHTLAICLKNEGQHEEAWAVVQDALLLPGLEKEPDLKLQLEAFDKR